MYSWFEQKKARKAKFTIPNAHYATAKAIGDGFLQGQRTLLGDAATRSAKNAFVPTLGEFVANMLPDIDMGKEYTEMLQQSGTETVAQLIELDPETYPAPLDDRQLLTILHETARSLPTTENIRAGLMTGCYMWTTQLSEVIVKAADEDSPAPKFVVDDQFKSESSTGVVITSDHLQAVAKWALECDESGALAKHISRKGVGDPRADTYRNWSELGRMIVKHADSSLAKSLLLAQQECQRMSETGDYFSKVIDTIAKTYGSDMSAADVQQELLCFVYADRYLGTYANELRFLVSAKGGSFDRRKFYDRVKRNGLYGMIGNIDDTFNTPPSRVGRRQPADAAGPPIPFFNPNPPNAEELYPLPPAPARGTKTTAPPLSSPLRDPDRAPPSTRQPGFADASAVPVDRTFYV